MTARTHVGCRGSLKEIGGNLLRARAKIGLEEEEEEMDVTANAERFVAFLLDCTSSGESELNTYSYEVDLGDGKSEEIAVTLLPPLVHSPLSEIAGGPPLTCPIVVLASSDPLKEEVEEDENGSPDLKPILGHYSHSLSPAGNDSHERKMIEEAEEEEECKKRRESVVLAKRETIFLGSKVSQNPTSLPAKVSKRPSDLVVVSRLANLNRLSCLSLDLARTMISLYLIGARAKGSAGLPGLWVPCTHTEGAIKEDIVGIGCTPMAKSEEDLNVTVYSVREKSQMSGGGRETRIKGADIRLGKAELNGSAFAKYTVMAAETNTAGEGAEISVEFSWKNPDSFLSPPSAFGTEAVLNIAVEPGTLQAILSSFTELQTLLQICEAASEGREWWGDPQSEEDEEESILEHENADSLVNKVRGFLNTVDNPLSSSHEYALLSPTLENTLFKQRKMLDFSENLWLFLKDAHSQYDFQASLVALFKELMFGKRANFALRESSKSPIAALLREILKCKSEVEQKELAPKVHLLLSPTRSVPCLAMMGIEKLRQDFKVFLTAAGVASEADVADFLRVDDGDNEEEDILQQCHSLCNLYQVVELVGTAMSLQCLPLSSLTLLTKSAMSLFQRKLPFVSFETTPLFSVSLPQVSTVIRPIVELCEGSNAYLSTWSLRSKTEKTFVMKSKGLRGEKEEGHVYEVSYTEL